MPASQLSGRKHSQQVIEIPILCRFWKEDGVWNGEAVHLPVVVFGNTIEEAMSNLNDGLLTHLDAEQSVGTLEKTIEYLRSCAEENSLTLNDVAPNRLLSRFNAALQDHRVVALV